MTPSAPSQESSDLILAEVVEEFTNRLQAGEAVDVEEYARKHPEHAERLRQLLPALSLLDALGRSVSPVPGSAGIASREGSLEGTLGDFRIVREVGRGGMGIVYEAEQISLRRRVALKVLPFAATMDARHLQRFHNEAQAAACLHHTNIVPVFSVGCERSVHFYAMQFIDGQPLSEIIHQLQHAEKKAATPAAPEQTVAYQLPPDDAIATNPTARPVAEVTPLTSEGRRGREYYRKAAELGVQAAEALDHAHQLGIVHRDVKPANLLVDSRGNVWVTDFGLAHMQHSEASLTLTGQAVGTPRYMSPEQALAKRVPIDHRTDVYSLGVTLYELLTLRPAFSSEDRHELQRQIAFEEPAKPRRLERTIPAELEIIVLKAMEKRPQDRYATAQELGEDLRRWLFDQPIRARRPTLRERLVKWLRRHKTLMRAASAVLFLATLGLATGSFLIWQEQKQTKAALKDAREQRQAAQENAAKAESQRQRAMANLDQALNAIGDLWEELDRGDWTDTPRFREIRRVLVQRIQRRYESFVKKESADPAVRFEMARAYTSLSSLHEMQGNVEEAEQARRKAIALFEALTVDCPVDKVYWKQLGHSHALMAWQLEDKGMIGQAVGEYRKALQAFGEVMRLAPDDPSALNNMAWTLVVSRLPEIRNPLKAIELAQKATQLRPQRAAHWNTLGVAFYRAGDWTAALIALEKSRGNINTGDADNWFFLAMTHWRLGHKKEARRYHDNAVQWMDENKPNNKELRRWV